MLSAGRAGTTAMRIDNNDLSGTSSSAIGASQAAGASQKVRSANELGSAAGASGKAASRLDEVQLSSVADRVNAGGLSVNQPNSTEHAARIAQLTKLVQSGQYHPDPVKLADSVIGDMLSGAGSA